jgi:hypothetical protein
MDEKTVVDISQFSFEEFVTFMFDREVQDKTEEWNPWYWHINVSIDPQRLCGYFTRLFSAPGFLLERFSKAQLEEGFWAIPSGGYLECSVNELIWNTNLPFADREECVKSMFYLYRDLFAAEPLDSAASMWWDTLCWDLWHQGNRDRLRGGEDMTMQDVMFETLVRILALDSEHCQKAALHGLGHLHHPAADEAIQGYLAKHPSLSEEWREYALAAARFEVQ